MIDIGQNRIQPTSIKHCRKVTSAAAANSCGVDEEIAAIGRFTQPIVPPRSTAMIPPSQVSGGPSSLYSCLL